MLDYEVYTLKTVAALSVNGFDEQTVGTRQLPCDFHMSKNKMTYCLRAVSFEAVTGTRETRVASIQLERHESPSFNTLSAHLMSPDAYSDSR